MFIHKYKLKNNIQTEVFTNISYEKTISYYKSISKTSTLLFTNTLTIKTLYPNNDTKIFCAFYWKR